MGLSLLQPNLGKAHSSPAYSSMNLPEGPRRLRQSSVNFLRVSKTCGFRSRPQTPNVFSEIYIFGLSAPTPVVIRDEFIGG